MAVNTCKLNTPFKATHVPPPASPLLRKVSQWKFLSPRSGTSLFGHMLCVCVCVCVCVPGLPPNFKLPACMGSLGKLTLPQMPTMPRDIFMDSYFIFLFFSHTNEPTWHTNNVPYLVPTRKFCAQMYTLYCLAPTKS